MMSLTKNLQLPTKKVFFHCRLEDLPNLFRVWTALQCNRRSSYAVGKATDNCWF